MIRNNPIHNVKCNQGMMLLHGEDVLGNFHQNLQQNFILHHPKHNRFNFWPNQSKVRNHQFRIIFRHLELLSTKMLLRLNIEELPNYFSQLILTGSMLLEILMYQQYHQLTKFLRSNSLIFPCTLHHPLLYKVKQNKSNLLWSSQ